MKNICCMTTVEEKMRTLEINRDLWKSEAGFWKQEAVLWRQEALNAREVFKLRRLSVIESKECYAAWDHYVRHSVGRMMTEEGKEEEEG